MINESFIDEQDNKYCPHCDCWYPRESFQKHPYCNECWKTYRRQRRAEEYADFPGAYHGRLKATRKCPYCGETFAETPPLWADDAMTICIGCDYEAETDRIRAKLADVQAIIRGSAQVQAVIRAGKVGAR